jgi:acyl carrier protein
MVYEKVVEYITQQLPVSADSVKPESRLVEDLGADSANMMMLIMDLEAEFDMTVEDDALTKIKTVDDIVKYIEKRVG